jgi:hypothetical protein
VRGRKKEGLFRHANSLVFGKPISLVIVGDVHRV